jgi:TRAP-type C4-dicarboxylate transport system permease small subunit
MIVGCVGGMIAIVATQIVARYGLNSSIGWSDEVSRLLFVWSIFLAIPIGVRRGSHIGVTLLTARLPADHHGRLRRAMMALASGLTLLVTFQALTIATAQWDELMVSIDLSASWFLLALAVGCGHATLHLWRIALFGEVEAPP